MRPSSTSADPTPRGELEELKRFATSPSAPTTGAAARHAIDAGSLREQPDELLHYFVHNPRLRQLTRGIISDSSTQCREVARKCDGRLRPSIKMFRVSAGVYLTLAVRWPRG